MRFTQSIKQKALDSGFDLVGITSASLNTSHVLFFEQWLSEKKHATMEWMTHHAEKRKDIQKVLANASSVICCGLSYYRGYPLSIHSREEGRGWISNYAWGEDYHQVVLQKLEELERFIHEANPQAKTKSYVDTGPLLERSYANQAGLGWIGKNTCLIHRHRGSFFFLGEIITDVKLDYDRPEADRCGKCTRCVDACPTRALTPYALNANRCVSYLTIEHRGEIDPKLQSQMAQNMVGCDICQDVCPWNQAIPIASETRFDPKPDLFQPLLKDLEQLIPEEFSTRFQKSPIRRVKWEGFQRNMKIAVKNVK